MSDPGELHHATFELTGVLLECLEGGDSYPAVREHLGRTGLDLLDAVTLVGGQPSVERFDLAAEALERVEVQLGLAHALSVLTEPDFLDLMGQSERVGAELTRWQKALGL